LVIVTAIADNSLQKLIQANSLSTLSTLSTGKSTTAIFGSCFHNKASMETEPQSHLNSGLKMTTETELEIEMMAGVIRSLFSFLVSQQTPQTVKTVKTANFLNWRLEQFSVFS
jgi:hypothetical protein